MLNSRRLSLIIALVCACKPSGGDSQSVANSTNNRPVETQTGTDTSTSNTDLGSETNIETNTDIGTHTEPVNAGKIALITNPSEILTTIDSAVQSTFAGNLAPDGSREPISFAPGQVAIGLSLQGANLEDECVSSAEPRKAGGTSTDERIPVFDPHYAAGRFYCLLRFNTYAPNSVQGAYYQNKAFLCDLNRQGVLVEGSKRLAKIDFSNKECYSDAFRELSFSDGLPPPFEVAVEYSRPSKIAPDKWDSSVIIDMPPEFGNMSITVLSKTTNEGLSTAAIVGKSTYILTYNIAGGILRIDSQSTPNPLKQSDTRYSHYRIYARGSINDDLQFDSLSYFMGIDSSSYVNSQNNARVAEINSFSMDFAKGGRGYSVQCSGECQSLINFGSNTASTLCYAGDGGVKTCSSIMVLSPKSDDDLAFTLIPGAVDENHDGRAVLEAGPLEFDTISFAVIEPQ